VTLNEINLLSAFRIIIIHSHAAELNAKKGKTETMLTSRKADEEEQKKLFRRPDCTQNVKTTTANDKPKV
jgi:hypothetical protein